MLKNLLLICILFTTACTPKLSSLLPEGKDLNTYHYGVDLTSIDKDQLLITLVPPAVTSQEATFCLPSIVPGIYGEMNFGKNVFDLTAYGEKGNKLEVIKKGINCWTVKQAQNIARITYRVKDTWDLFSDKGEEDFYRSAGSTFREKELFIFNNNALFGYFDNKEDLPYAIHVKKPKGFFGASSLQPTTEKQDIDLFTAPNYRELVDAPIFYAQPDTSWIDLSGTKVLIAVHSPDPEVTAKAVKNTLQPMLTKQRDYLGGTLPVDNYAFLILHNTTHQAGYFSGDALEHSLSSLYLLETKSVTELTSFMYGIAAHEFFHIITPLNIHSEAIENYDFNGENTSKHLWLYEGMTEYASLHMPIKEGLIGMDEFFRDLQEKLRLMKNYDSNISLTQLSAEIIDRQDQFYNIYLKGALFGLCLDVKLRELSKGQYGTQDLMDQLSKKYGKNKPFEEEELFDEIASLTYPEIRTFFRDHVEGTVPLPLKETFRKVGIELNENLSRLKLSENPTTSQLALRKAWIEQ